MENKNHNMKRFVKNNEERLKELAKLSGKDREDYLISIINELETKIQEFVEFIDNIE